MFTVIDPGIDGLLPIGGEMSREDCAEAVHSGMLHAAPQGTLRAWGKKSGRIVEFQIGADVPRSCATTRKHRSASVLVVSIDGETVDADGKPLSFVHDLSSDFTATTYTVGEVTTADGWDADRWNECSNGIHWFLTKEEAEAWE